MLKRVGGCGWEAVMVVQICTSNFLQASKHPVRQAWDIEMYPCLPALQVDQRPLKLQATRRRNTRLKWCCIALFLCFPVITAEI